MLELRYKGRYIPTEIVEQCFVKGQFNFVDKTFTGNGFTTSFLQLKPASHKVNIIIVPNQEVLISKKLQYDQDTDPNKTRIGFFGDIEGRDKTYQMFKKHSLIGSKFDTLMFVVDTFLRNFDTIEKRSYMIEKILIDEAHSVATQSTFRPYLIGFIRKMQSSFLDVPKVQVTATPMLFQKVDIKITKPIKEHKTINISSNEKKCLKRALNDLNEGRNVIIATHKKNIIRKIVKGRKGNYKVGENLIQNLVEVCEVKQDPESNLTIISSRGFEGFDVDNGINNIYIFEDRAYDYSTFYFQNILQAIGRSRKGVNEVYYCSVPISDYNDLKSKDQMMLEIKKHKGSFEKLLTNDKTKYLKRFIQFKVEDGFINGIDFNDTSYGLYKEHFDHNDNSVKLYKDYALDRGYKIHFLNEGIRRISNKGGWNKHQAKVNMLKVNSVYIDKNNVFANLQIDTRPKESKNEYLEELKKFVRRKHYKNDIGDILDNHKPYQYITNDSIFDTAIKHLSKEYREKKLNEYKGDRYNKDFIKEVSEFNEKIKDLLYRLCLMFSQDKPKPFSKKIIWRDYNLTTEASLFVLAEVGNLFDFDTYEFDISSCNPRIIYAYNGLSLPENFYGENKVNKRQINILLNTLSKEYAIEKGLNLYKRKARIKQNLIKYGFDQRVIEFLLTFWDRPKDALFNFCAYHEMKIINETERVLINEFKDYFRFIRRHDSLIVFTKDRKADMDQVNDFADNVEYLDRTCWYSGKNLEEIMRYFNVV